jgi:transposase
MGYTKDFKMAVIKFDAEGNTLEKTARTFSIGTGTVSRWKRQFRAKESLERKVQERRHMRKVTPEKIDELLRIKYDMNQKEMAEALGCTSQSVSVALKKFGYTRKKNGKHTTKPMKGRDKIIYQKLKK